MRKKIIEKLNDAPIIVCGMHRSGTSFVSRFLSDIGIFMGNDTEINHESLSFLLLNDKLLALAHSFWDQTAGASFFFNNESAINQAVELLKTKFLTPTFFKPYLGKRNIPDNYKNWGWKDPRNTITFPLWIKVFINAKFIFIYRNGVDSAASLLNREEKQNFNITIPAYSSRCRDLESAFGLWKEYNAFFLEHKEKINAENLLEIKYEDLLKEPTVYLDLISTFLQKEISQKIKTKIIKETNSGRAFSFKENKELEDFYSKVKNDEIMVRLNYDNI